MKTTTKEVEELAEYFWLYTDDECNHPDFDAVGFAKALLTGLGMEGVIVEEVV